MSCRDYRLFEVFVYWLWPSGLLTRPFIASLRVCELSPEAVRLRLEELLSLRVDDAREAELRLPELVVLLLVEAVADPALRLFDSFITFPIN